MNIHLWTGAEILALIPGCLGLAKLVKVGLALLHVHAVLSTMGPCLGFLGSFAIERNNNEKKAKLTWARGQHSH